MEVTVHLDGDPAIREEGFFESKVINLQGRIRSLEYDNAQLVKTNEELSDRITKLGTRQPSWPKGYRPNTNRR